MQRGEVADTKMHVVDILMQRLGDRFSLPFPLDEPDDAVLVDPRQAHIACYALCCLMALGISPVLWQKGLSAFAMVALYLASLSAIKTLVRTAEQHGFMQPYSMTSLHMLVTALASGLLAKPKMSEALRVFPIAVVVGAALLLNNSALMFGGVAFVAMIGCSTPAITFFLQIAIGRASLTMQALLPLVVVCIGSFMCITGEKSATVLALLLSTLATFFRSLKGVLQHECLQQNMTPISLVFWSTFWGFLLLAPMALLTEVHRFRQACSTADAVGMRALLGSSLAAACLNVSQCFAVKIMGPLQLNVLGNLNLLMVVLIAVGWLGEVVTGMQYLGVSILVTGVLMSSQAERFVQKEESERTPLINQLTGSSKYEATSTLGAMKHMQS